MSGGGRRSRTVAAGLALAPAAALALSACNGYAAYAEVRSPDGARTALLTRPRGSMEPIYYSVRIKGAGDCIAAKLEGYEAESWVRMAWSADDALTIRYGVPLGHGMKPVAPAVWTGEDACRDVRLTIVEDPSLAPPPSHNAPGYERVQYDPKDPYKGGTLPANSAQRGREGADPAVGDGEAGADFVRITGSTSCHAVTIPGENCPTALTPAEAMDFQDAVAACAPGRFTPITLTDGGIGYEAVADTVSEQQRACLKARISPKLDMETVRH